MTEEIQIDITITMGDTCSNTMSLDEARMLHSKLGELFGMGNTLPYTGIRATGSSEPINATPKNIVKNSIPEPVVTNQANDVPTPKEAVTMPPPNLKVEAARQRAAQRTKGCGQR